MYPTFLKKVMPLSLEVGGTYPDIFKRTVPLSSKTARSHDILIMAHEGSTLLRKSGYVQLCIIQEDQNSQLSK